MTKDTTYSVARIEGPSAALPMFPFERECALLLSDARWHLICRASGFGVSGGLLPGRLTVEARGRRSSGVSIVDSSGDGFEASVVLHASASRVQRDLDRRLSSLERGAELVAQVTSGAWWLDGRVFSRLDWSGRRSVAGIRYRAGWWGTGRLKPSMLPKVLDFGPSGVVLRGWRTHVVIPWDAIESLRVVEGDCWLPAGAGLAPTKSRGATLTVRSLGGQDAVFFSPLMSAEDVGRILTPLAAHLPTPGVITG
jgi:hypothetical protein